MPRDDIATATESLPNIETLVAPTHDETARQRYVSVLRKHIMADMSRDMREAFDEDIAPAYQAAHGEQPADARAVRKAMEPTPVYRFYSSMRYNAQEMVWNSVHDPIERAIPAMMDVSAKAIETNPAGGTLRLNPDLDIPKAVSSLDIHLMPGCFHSEFAADDVSGGAVYALGTEVFSGLLRAGKIKGAGGVADSIAFYLRYKYPNYKVRRILDLGCTTGSNLLPYRRAFPDAELYGVDVGAPMLRYAHARAEAMGVPAHFSQQNAENMDFPDGHFDLIVSSFFFHELPVASTKKILKEIHRLLKPGGLTAHMELPPSSAADPYYNFYLDWDAYHNHEPHYAQFRAQDPVELLTEAGFARNACDTTRIPDRGKVTPEEFEAFARGEAEAPAHGNFASYFVFGALR